MASSTASFLCIRVGPNAASSSGESRIDNRTRTIVSAGSRFHRYKISRMGYVPKKGKMVTSNTNIFASIADISTDNSVESLHLHKGDMWSVHKFGGTCVGTAKRIQNVADIILNDASERKLVVVSAMSQVTDMMYNLIHRAQARDGSYISALDDISEKHRLTASELLDGDDLDRFLSQLHADISNLKAMLRAICIAGHATESFSDFVVGHGELWSAQMLSALLKKHGLSCTWMDTREVLVVNPTASNQVDPEYVESKKRLEKWFSQNQAKTIIATGFIASTPQNIPTTLKRDGSDFSAAIMGALVRAQQVTIWTDVDGVYSADPRKGSNLHYRIDMLDSSVRNLLNFIWTMHPLFVVSLLDFGNTSSMACMKIEIAKIVGPIQVECSLRVAQIH